jgi:hypothetical protein
MGKERDKLIRRLGGVPLSDRNLSDDELLEEYFRGYREKGELPPEIRALRRRMEEAGGEKTDGRVRD